MQNLTANCPVHIYMKGMCTKLPKYDFGEYGTEIGPQQDIDYFIAVYNSFYKCVTLLNV